MIGSFNSTFQTFLNDHISSNEGEQTNLFANYTPSFMNDAHQIPSFEHLMKQCSTASSQLLNSFFTNESNDLFNSENVGKPNRKNSFITLRSSEQTGTYEEAEDCCEDQHNLSNQISDIV